ncbi:MAG: guanylate kinase [Desulfuromonadales bacterium]
MSNDASEPIQGGIREGILYVLSAPSGAGKTSLCREIIDFFPNLRQSISFTTRPLRKGEIDGKDYHFVDRAAFEEMISEGAFAEWAEVHDNLYGTSLATLEDGRRQGVDLLLDIDCQGAAQLRRNYRHGVYIFILPPSMEELQGRLEGRKTDAAAVIERRLLNARDEIRQAVFYDYVVVNAEFAVAAEELKSILRAEACRVGRVLPALAGIFDF